MYLKKKKKNYIKKKDKKQHFLMKSHLFLFLKPIFHTYNVSRNGNTFIIQIIIDTVVHI